MVEQVIAQILGLFPYTSTFPRISPDLPEISHTRCTQSCTGKASQSSKISGKVPTNSRTLPIYQHFPTHFCRPPRDLTHTLYAKLHRQSIAKLQNFRMHWFGDLKKRSSYRWTCVPVTRGGSSFRTKAWASLPDQTQKRKKYIRVEKGMRKTTPFRCAASEPAHRQSYKVFFTWRNKIKQINNYKRTSTISTACWYVSAGCFTCARYEILIPYWTLPQHTFPIKQTKKQCASIPVYKTLHGCFLFFATYVMPLTFWSPVG